VCYIFLLIFISFIQLQEKQTELSQIVKELESEQERFSNLRNTTKAKLEHELASYYEQIETMQNEKESFEADTVRLKNMRYVIKFFYYFWTNLVSLHHLFQVKDLVFLLIACPKYISVYSKLFCHYSTSYFITFYFIPR
jgi:hypothetical protein